MDDYQSWVGREQVSTDLLRVEQARLMEATLNREPSLQVGDMLPLAWHWLYFHEAVPGEQLGVEGHPALGGFMPPVSFGDGQPPRRMWAGGKIVFERPLPFNQPATKTSRIKAVTPKQGRSGRLFFVTVEHEVGDGDKRHIYEEQTIVYREPLQEDGGQPTPKAAPAQSDFSASWHSDPIMLFRYSALTFNGHRIHYDVDFCRQREGYPDLVVHGPLLLTLLLDLFAQQSFMVSGCTYRMERPLFCGRPFSVHGNQNGDGWAADEDGDLLMSAQVMV